MYLLNVIVFRARLPLILSQEYLSSEKQLLRFLQLSLLHVKYGTLRRFLILFRAPECLFQVLEFYHDVILQLYLNHTYFPLHLNHDGTYLMSRVFSEYHVAFPFLPPIVAAFLQRTLLTLPIPLVIAPDAFYLLRPFPYATLVLQFLTA